MSNKSGASASGPAQAISKGPVKQAESVVPMTVAGQRYIPPAGRHSQKKRLQAEARAQSLGLTTVRELHDYDRQQVLAKLQKGVDGVAAQQRNEQNRRGGVMVEKA